MIFVDGDEAGLANSVSALKADPTTANIPIVLLTTGSSTDILVDLWFSYSPPDFTVRRPISNGFLDEHIQALATQGTSKKSGSKTKDSPKTSKAPPPAAAPTGDSQLVKALTEQIANMDEEIKKYGVEYFIGAHCTGIDAVYSIRKLNRMSRDQCAVGAVGGYFDLEKGMFPGLISQ